ncbi:MAG: Glu-tRNA(Gln) amidotransferase subunit GatE [archaeon]
MSEIDYSKLNFRAGLEIHQQLDSHKLFCNCESVLRKDEPDFEIRRKLHAVAGESGEVDIAAMHEVGKGKEFVYQGYDSVCLVELDEEPPHEINKEALKIGLQICFLLNCKIVPITQIMRKTVIDGSNTSGFQRTVMIGRDGYVETESGRVGIDYIYLEEDAARIVAPQVYPEESSAKILTKGKSGGVIVYKLDRLGIPLVEVVTAPDVKSPEQAKEVALKIGEILRSCKVRRGIGTIRQDVNISIRGENRVEVKGMQDMKIFVKAIENEIERQKELSDSKNPVEMEVRNVLPDATTKFMRPLPGGARMYPETDLPLLRISRNFINESKKSLPKLKGEVEGELKDTGLNQEMIKLLLKENKIEEFKELSDIISNPMLIAKMLLVFPKEIAHRENESLEKVNEMLEDNFGDVLIALKRKKISEGQVKEALGKIVRGEDVAGAVRFEKEDLGDVEEKIREIIKEKPGLSEKAYMGLVMKEFRGRVDGKSAVELIRKYVK